MGYKQGDLSSCDYFQGKGICTHGCWEEPACMTDEPLEGWPSGEVGVFAVPQEYWDKKRAERKNKGLEF